MPDFDALVRERLRLSHVEARRAAEIHAELTAHLDDVYAAALAEGDSREDAARRALAEVNDWSQLAHDVACASTEDGLMSHHMRTLWLPGLTMVGCAAVVLIGIGWFLPGEWWANRSAESDYVAGTGAIVLYLLLGAVGAGWSRRAGGTWRERLGAALLPAALHLTMTIAAIVASMLVESQQHPSHALNPQLRVLVVFVIIPTIALSIGAAPFLMKAGQVERAG